MSKVAITEQYLSDIADAIRSKTGASSVYKPSEMADAVSRISGGGGITPTGTISITTNGTHNVYNYASANVNVTSSINNQNKTVNPLTTQQSVTADAGYTGLGTVTVNAMPAGSATAPATISGSSASVSTGTNALTLTKAIDVTPAVTAGYISGGTTGSSNVSLTATVVTKGATTYTPTTSNQTIESGTYLTGVQTVLGDSNLRSENIKKNVRIFNVDGAYEGGGGGTPVIDSLTVTPSTSEQVFNSSSVDGYKPVTVSAVPTASFFSGATAEYSGNYFMITPYTELDTSLGDVEGYISEGHWDSEEPLLYLFVPSNTSITPTESRQTVGGSNYMMQGAVTVEAISSTYVGSGITRRSSTDLTVSGATVTAPFGYYANNATKSISAGSATGPSSLSGTSATVTTGTNTITLTKTGVSTTPTVSAGYVASATSSTATVALTASVTTKAAATITPSTSDQTIASGTYLTGTQTISGDANLKAENIKKDISIFNILGAYEGSGGGGIGTLLATQSLGTVNTTSTQAASLNISLSVSGINDYDLLIVDSSVNTVTNGRHTSTVGLIFLTAGSSIGTKNGATVATVKLNSKISSSGVTTTVAGTTAYGVYPNSCTISNGTASIPMYRRYNSTSTTTINGTYTARVYGVNLYDLIGG